MHSMVIVINQFSSEYGSNSNIQDLQDAQQFDQQSIHFLPKSNELARFMFR